MNFIKKPDSFLEYIELSDATKGFIRAVEEEVAMGRYPDFIDFYDEIVHYSVSGKEILYKNLPVAYFSPEGTKVNKEEALEEISKRLIEVRLDDCPNLLSEVKFCLYHQDKDEIQINDDYYPIENTDELVAKLILRPHSYVYYNEKGFALSFNHIAKDVDSNNIRRKSFFDSSNSLSPSEKELEEGKKLAETIRNFKASPPSKV
jgi:hypothetical protein